MSVNLQGDAGKLARALVIGASRGLGKALAEELAGRGGLVTATVRGDPGKAALAGRERIDIMPMDLADEDAGIRLAASFDPADLDLVILNAGIFGPDHQSVSLVGPDDAGTLFWTNAVAPVRVAEALLSRVRPGGVIAFMSSRTASIALNADGDMALYRASKTALNALARSFAITQALPANVGVALLHPGWVQTDMGGSDAPVTVAQSVGGLCDLLASALDHVAFRFLDYLGDELPW